MRVGLADATPAARSRVAPAERTAAAPAESGTPAPAERRPLRVTDAR